MKKCLKAFAFGLLILIGCRAMGQSPIVAFRSEIRSTANTVTPLHLNKNLLQPHDAASGQPPNIVYPSPQVYTLNQAIPSLQPGNTGGDVPSAIYGQVSKVNGTVTSYPSGIATDAAGNCYFTAYSSGSIIKVSPSGSAKIIANVSSPAGMAIDQQGNLYVTDFDQSLIYKITPTGTKTVFAGKSGNKGITDGKGSIARFSSPGGICIDAQDNLYVLDKDLGRIRKITPDGTVSTITLSGNAFVPGADGICIDTQGNIYIADSPNNRIKKVTPANVISVLAGSGAAKSKDGTGTAAAFNYPTGITVDSQGNLYVTDYHGAVIREITPAGVVTTIAGSGASVSIDGIGRKASFGGPLITAFDPTGNALYITDFTGGAVKKLSLSGYTIDRALPTGLMFDAKTGIISGTPTALSAASNYTITAYNGFGSSKSVVSIAVTSINSLLPSVITFPPQEPNMLGAGNYYDPQATSTNNETPITYASSDPSVAYIYTRRTDKSAQAGCYYAYRKPGRQRTL